MTDVVMHPASLGILSDGCHSNHQHYLYCLRGLRIRTFTQCFPCASGLSFPLAFKQDNGASRIKSPVAHSIFEGNKACLGVPQESKHKTRVLLKSVVCDDPTTVPGRTADVDNQTASNYEEKERTCEGSIQQEVCSSENLINQQELGLHQQHLALNQLLLDPEEADNMDRRAQSTSFYLEDMDEEELSRRILKLSRLNRIKSAFILYKSMEVFGLRPSSHACNSMISCLLRNGRLDDALGLFHSMKARKLAAGHACSLILKAVANAWGCAAAQKLFEELESDNDFKNLFDTVVYNTMLSIFCKVNNWVQAENIWRSLQKTGFPGSAVTYRMLVCTFVRCGQNELAFDAYHEMVGNGLIPGEDAMQAVIGACAKEGEWELALSVFQNMLNHGFKPNIISCNALITSLGKYGKVKLAFKVYDLLESLGHSPDAYTWNALLGALNKANQPADALHLFDCVKKSQSSFVNLQVYITLLMSCQKLGLWGKALQLLWQMEASGIPLSVAPYNLVIGACEVARKPKVALQIYDHMVHQKLSPDVFTLLSLIRSCIWGSLWDEVEDILHRYPPNGSLYNAAFQGFCLCGNIDLAMKIYGKMNTLDLKPDGKTRALMLQKLSKLRKKVIVRRHKSYTVPRRRKR